MNKKTLTIFFLGVIFGVAVSWSLSFYLYFALNSFSDNTNTSKLLKLQKNIFNLDSENYGDSDEKLSNLIDGAESKLVSGKSSYIKIRMKKEKEKRKLSRKLIEELTPVTLSQDTEYGLIRNLEDQFIRDNGYKTHAFNVLVSNQIGLKREIQDTRHKM